MCLKLDKNIKNVLYPLTEWIQGKRHVAYPAFSHENKDDNFLTILKQIQLLWE